MIWNTIRNAPCPSAEGWKVSKLLRDPQSHALQPRLHPDLHQLHLHESQQCNINASTFTINEAITREGGSGPAGGIGLDELEAAAEELHGEERENVHEHDPHDGQRPHGAQRDRQRVQDLPHALPAPALPLRHTALPDPLRLATHTHTNHRGRPGNCWTGPARLGAGARGARGEEDQERASLKSLKRRMPRRADTLLLPPPPPLAASTISSRMLLMTTCEQRASHSAPRGAWARMAGDKEGDQAVELVEAVGEVVGEAEAHPLEDHLRDEDARQHLIDPLQDRVSLHTYTHTCVSTTHTPRPCAAGSGEEQAGAGETCGEKTSQPSMMSPQ
eukprot:3596566-Rhodomonas_salina.1